MNFAFDDRIPEVEDVVLEIEDFFPRDQADYIESALLKSRLFPWNFNDNAVSNDNEDLDTNIPGFFNLIYDETRREKTEYYDLLMPIPLQLGSKVGIDFNEIQRIQANLTFPTGIEGHHLPHLDNFGHHYVAIYYVNNSAGPTYLFENTNKEYSLKYDKEHNHDWKVLKKVEPKKGKLVFFNGYRYHASSSPVGSQVRSVININIR